MDSKIVLFYSKTLEKLIGSSEDDIFFADGKWRDASTSYKLHASAAFFNHRGRGGAGFRMMGVTHDSTEETEGC
jgi:hypothetical protein